MFKLKFCYFCGKPFFKERYFHGKEICNSCNNEALYWDTHLLQELKKHLKK